ncbi:MAG: hypothetical protein WCX84_01970 [Syntrophales bacterium]|nr:hypothetical protein [Syntrophales bacterium]
MTRTAIIDIDNTLWPFSDALYCELKKINIRFPSPDQWFNFDIWETYCSQEDFFTAINTIHHGQENDLYQPYPEARDFLSALKANGYHLTLASHRVPSTRAPTEQWLEKHRLPYDELHLSLDKTVLFSRADVIVDDAPPTLKTALTSGIPATGLLCPWNQVCANHGFRLFSNLNEVLDYILKTVL